MTLLSFLDYVNTPDDLTHSRLTDLWVTDVGGTAQLYGTTRYDGFLRQWNISSEAMTLDDSQPFGGSLVPGGTGGIVGFSFDAAPGLLVGGGPGGALQTITLGPDGGFAATNVLDSLPSAYAGFQLGAASMMPDGTQIIWGALAGQSGLAQLIFDDAGALQSQAILQDATAGTSSAIQATVTAEVAGQQFVITASGAFNGLTARAFDNAGQVTNTVSIAADAGLWISAPTGLATAVVGGVTYLILAAAGTDSLSVVALNPDGSMEMRDHVLDARDTRFGDVAALEVVQSGGKTYVIAGGGDDGISVFALLEGGFLLHLESIADTVDAGLDNVSSIAGWADGTAIDIFVGSSSEPGITRLRLDTGIPGITDTADAGGGAQTGSLGNDILQGQQGDDLIAGGAGDDIIRDGAGSDVMAGGAGADVFILSPDGAVDTITDFTVGEDRLDLSLWPMLRDISQLFISLQPDGMRIIYGDEVLYVQSADGEPIDYRTLTTADVIGGTRLPVDLVPGFSGPETPPPPVGDPPGGVPTDSGDPYDSLFPPQLISSNHLSDLRDALDDATPHSGAGLVIDGGSTADLLIGAEGADQIFAGGGDDFVLGEGGNDSLFGRSGNDRLDGGAGADTLLGGTGADILDGGAGNDLLTGGMGTDIFVFNSGTDRITDFTQGVDTIQLDPSLWTGLTSAADVLSFYGTFTDGRATIDFDDGNVLIIDGITDPEILAADITLF